MMTELRDLENRRFKGQRDLEGFQQAVSNQSEVVQIINGMPRSKFRNTIVLLNSEAPDQSDHLFKSTMLIADDEQKLEALIKKEQGLRLENQELTGRTNSAKMEVQHRKDEFERVMSQMMSDFSAKKKQATATQIKASLEADDKRRQILTQQAKRITILTDQLTKLEFVKNARSLNSLMDLWYQNNRLIDDLTRSGVKLSPHPQSSKKTVNLGSDAFEDYELKTSIDNSNRKVTIRTVKSQSPGKVTRFALDMNMKYVQNEFESIEEIESYRFPNNSEFTEKHFSNKKETRTIYGQHIPTQP